MFVPTKEIKINNAKLGPDIIDQLYKIKVSRAANAISMARVMFQDANLEFQSNKNFKIGKSVSISLGHAKAVEVFAGEIVRIDYKFAPSQTPILELVCYDKLFKLSRMVHSRPFVKKKDSDIARAMASEAGLQSNVDVSSTTHEYILQNNESNLQFLRRRAQKLGYEVAIDGGKLIFKNARFKDKKKSIVLDYLKDRIHFDVTLDASNVIEEAVVSSWDYVKKKELSQKRLAGSETAIGSARQKGSTMVKKEMRNKSKSYIENIPNLTVSDAKTIATASITQASQYFLNAKGRCHGDPAILPGKLLSFKNFGKSISGDYYIVACEHIYHNDIYETHFELTSNGLA
ncbi:MAG: phage late control D family protein [Campylobacterales bacterium]|nr:phage late control D family protein [Campylobacterales bacterium]